jgi:hypothetical protein
MTWQVIAHLKAIDQASFAIFIQKDCPTTVTQDLGFS